MRASSASGFSIDVVFDGAGDARLPILPAVPRSQRSRSTTWPVATCAVFALLAACAAFTESPLGQRPTVRPYTDAAHVAVTNAWREIESRFRK